MNPLDRDAPVPLENRSFFIVNHHQIKSLLTTKKYVNRDLIKSGFNRDLIKSGDLIFIKSK